MKVDIEGAATITIERSSRARRMRITVSPEDVRVAVPKGVSLETGRAFAIARQQWIQKHVAKIEQRKKAHEKLLHDLPPITDVNKARQKIISRCEELAQKTGFSYGRIVIRNQKTRWGSCSSVGTISLNIKLARLPLKLLDYVILHELVHTRIKGHGKAFWNELDSLIGHARSLRSELRQYILRLL
jgi:predicted metal-dependent hydrolase